MSEQPDPGPGWRIAGGDDWKDERCEVWWHVSKKCDSRAMPGEPFAIGDFYRIPIDEPKPDLVNAPPHYRQGGIECIDAIRAALTDEEFRGYLKGNSMKYLWREKHKGDKQAIQLLLPHLIVANF